MPTMIVKPWFVHVWAVVAALSFLTFFTAGLDKGEWDFTRLGLGLTQLVCLLYTRVILQYQGDLPRARVWK